MEKNQTKKKGYIHKCCCLVAKSCPVLCDPTDYVAQQAPLSMRFPRQEYRTGLSFPSPGDLPNPGIEATYPVSPAFADRFFTTVLPAKSKLKLY